MKIFKDKYPNSNEHLLKRYFAIVRQDYTGYSGKKEKHHILPKSLFPDYVSSKENHVNIPARVHFIVHIILSKLLPESHEMVLAIYHMSNYGKYSSSRKFQAARLKGIDLLRHLNKEKFKSGKHNFCDGEIGRKICKKRMQEGTHNFQGENHPGKMASRNGTHIWNAWKNPRATIESKNVWYLSDEIKKVHDQESHLTYGKIYSILAKKYANTTMSKRSIETVLNKIDAGWNPTEDNEWLVFSKEFNNALCY